MAACACILSPHTFAHPLHGADLGAVFHLVNGKIDLGKRLLLLYGADGIINLLGAGVREGRPGRAGVLGIHLVDFGGATPLRW